MFKILHEIKQNDRCCTVAFDKNNEYFAFSERNYLKIYNRYELNNLDYDLVPTCKIKSDEDIIHAKFSPSGDIKSWKFEFGPSSREIATGCYSIMFYDLDSPLLEKTLEINNESKYSYCLCYLNSDIFAVGNSNGSIFIYSKDQRKRINKIGENCLPIRSIAYDELNKRLLAASDDLHINIIDAERFNIIMPVVGHKDNISALAVNQELGIFASSSHDGTVKIWDNKQLKCIQTIDLHSHSNLELTNEGNIVWDISFSNSGKELICGSDTGCHILTLA